MFDMAAALKIKCGCFIVHYEIRSDEFHVFFWQLMFGNYLSLIIVL